MEPHKDFKTILTEALELRNCTHEKLAQLTGISGHYLIAIENLEITKLPAAPYVRGYLKKIAAALHLNFEDLWKMYEKELTFKSSGAHDRLPTNRFAIQPINKKYWVFGAIGIILLVYLILNLRTFFGAPLLTIANPVEPTSASPVSVITLAGTINPKDKLTINGEETLGDDNGAFEKNYNLQPGLNTIEFKVQRLLGKENVIIRNVLYEPPATTTKNL